MPCVVFSDCLVMLIMLIPVRNKMVHEHDFNALPDRSRPVSRLIFCLATCLVFLHLSRLPWRSFSRDPLVSSSRVEFATSFDAVEKELQEKLGGKTSKCCVS